MSAPRTAFAVAAGAVDVALDAYMAAQDFCAYAMDDASSDRESEEARAAMRRIESDMATLGSYLRKRSRP